MPPLAKAARPSIASLADVESEMRDGDVLLFRGKYLVSRLFRCVNRSYYSHVAMVGWWGPRLLVLQSDEKGTRAVPMSVAVDRYYGLVEWYKLQRGHFPDVDGKLQATLEEAKADLGKRYGYFALLKNIWKWIARVDLRDPVRPSAMFCSQYVNHCYRIGKMPLTDREDITTMPKHIAASPHLELEQRIHGGLLSPSDAKAFLRSLRVSPG